MRKCQIFSLESWMTPSSHDLTSNGSGSSSGFELEGSSPVKSIRTGPACLNFMLGNVHNTALSEGRALKLGLVVLQDRKESASSTACPEDRFRVRRSRLE